MNNKQAKALRKIANLVTIGKELTITRKHYQGLKKASLEAKRNTSNKVRPIRDRKWRLSKNIVPSPLKPYIPKPKVFTRSIVKKGMKLASGRSYHPTKGFRKETLRFGNSALGTSFGGLV